MQDFKIFSLSDCAEIISGGTPKTSVAEYWNGNISWISIKDFSNEGKYIFETEKKITEEGLKKSSTSLLQRDDLIISARGTVGELAMIFSPMAFNQSCYGLRAKKNIIDADFLYYAVKNKINAIKKITHGTVFDTITKNTFNEIKIKVPPLEVQKKIAAVLSCLDDKIELNNKINQNLEQQAQAIFKNFFITNFNPAWKLGKLEDIAEIIMGQSPSGKSYNANKVGSIFFQGRTDFGFRFPKIRMFTTEPKKFAKKGDILLSVRAPVGDYNVAIDDCCIGRGLAAIFSKKNNNSFLLYMIANLQKKFNIFNGQGTVFGAINQKELKNIEIFIPEQKIIDDFEKIVSPMDKFIFEKHLESLNLAEIRDLLLPRLLNGEIDVSKVEI